MERKGNYPQKKERGKKSDEGSIFIYKLQKLLGLKKNTFNEEEGSAQQKNLRYYLRWGGKKDGPLSDPKYTFAPETKETVAEHVLTCFRYIRQWNKDFKLLTPKEEILARYTILYHDLDEYEHGDVPHIGQEAMLREEKVTYESKKATTIDKLVTEGKIPLIALDLYENFEHRHNGNFFMNLDISHRKAAAMAGIADCYQGNEFVMKNRLVPTAKRNKKDDARLQKELDLLILASGNGYQVNKFSSYLKNQQNLNKR